MDRAVAVDPAFLLTRATADVEDLMAERGVVVSREAIRLWVTRLQGMPEQGCIKTLVWILCACICMREVSGLSLGRPGHKGPIYEHHPCPDRFCYWIF